MIDPAGIEGIAAELRRILVDDLFLEGARSLGVEARLRDAGADSLAFVELRAAIEARWNLSVPPEDFVPDNFATIRRLSRYVLERTRGTGAG